MILGLIPIWSICLLNGTGRKSSPLKTQRLENFKESLNTTLLYAEYSAKLKFITVSPQLFKVSSQYFLISLHFFKGNPQFTPKHYKNGI